jgi:hypothetical protein
MSSCRNSIDQDLNSGSADTRARTHKSPVATKRPLEFREQSKERSILQICRRIPYMRRLDLVRLAGKYCWVLPDDPQQRSNGEARRFILVLNSI